MAVPDGEQALGLIHRLRVSPFESGLSAAGPIVFCRESMASAIGGCMSQLLLRLDQLIATASSKHELAELKVKKACYLSRTGYFDQAKQLIAEARADFGLGQSGRISAWIMLAEGITEFFSNPGAAAKDRIARSELIAVAIGDREIGAIACAWKALIEFELSNFELMASSLRKAFKLTDKPNLEARGRIAIVLSDCLYVCGDREGGQDWFMESRNCALEAGDQATIDALLYNKAAFASASLRVQRCFGPLESRWVDVNLLEVNSALNFQRMARILSVNHLIVLALARVLILKGEYVAAIEKLREVRYSGPFASYNFDQAVIDLEIAYCLLKSGSNDEAQRQIDGIADVDLGGLDIDERLVVSWVIKEIVGMGGSVAQSFGFDLDFEGIKRDYLLYRSSLRRLASDLADEWKSEQLLRFDGA